MKHCRRSFCNMTCTFPLEPMIESHYIEKTNHRTQKNGDKKWRQHDEIFVPKCGKKFWEKILWWNFVMKFLPFVIYGVNKQPWVLSTEVDKRPEVTVVVTELYFRDCNARGKCKNIVAFWGFSNLNLTHRVLNSYRETLRVHLKY